MLDSPEFGDTTVTFQDEESSNREDQVEIEVDNSPSTSNASSDKTCKGHTCEFCNKWFRQKSFLNRHLKSHQTENEFRCFVCPLEFKSLDGFRKHFIKSHDPEKKVWNKNSGNLARAEYKSFHSSNVNQNVSPSTSTSILPEPKKYKCDYEGCTKSFSSRSGRIGHKKSHNDRKMYSCTECSYECNAAGDMKKHYKAHPDAQYDVNKCKEEAKKSPGNAMPIKFQCQKCPMILDTQALLKRHQEYGHKKCRYCGKCLSTNECLKDHESIHTGEGRHACTKCDRRFFSKNSLDYHVSSVHDKRRYLCDKCGKSYTFIGRLKIHDRSVHQKLRFSCGKCSKSFCLQSSLKAHQKQSCFFITCSTCEPQKNFYSLASYNCHITVNKNSTCGQSEQATKFRGQHKKRIEKRTVPPLSEEEKKALITLRDLCRAAVNEETESTRKRKRQLEMDDGQVEPKIKRQKYSHVMICPCNHQLSEKCGNDDEMTQKKCPMNAVCFTSKQTPQERLLDLMKDLLKLRGCFSVRAHICQQPIHEMDVLAAKFIIKCSHPVIARAMKRMVTEFSSVDLITNVTRYYPLYYYGEDVYRHVAETLVNLNLQPIHEGTQLPLTADQLYERIKHHMTLKVPRCKYLPRGLKKIVMREGICCFEELTTHQEDGPASQNDFVTLTNVNL